MKLLIAGHARHGKDTFTYLLYKHTNLTFISSSEAANESFIYGALKEKYGYRSELECFEDRVNHREEWYNLIKEFNTPTVTNLGDYIYSNYDIYLGIRSEEEFIALKEKYPDVITIWIDASKRVPPEDASSCTLTREHGFDLIVNNNGTEAKLQKAIPFIWNKLQEVSREKGKGTT